MIADIMRSRRTVRRFKSEKLPREVVEDLISIAVTAPSASNKQPWLFLVIDDKDKILGLSQLVQASVDRIAHTIEPQYQDTFRSYGDYFTRFSCAPTIIVPIFKVMSILSNIVNDSLSDTDLKAIKLMEHNSSIVSTSLAVQNLLLYAHSKGIGTSCVTGPLVADQAIRDYLAISEDWQIANLICLGYADETPITTPRKTTQAVIRWLGKNEQ